MDRNDLTLAIAGALIAAFLLGWVLRWAFALLNAAGPRNAARTADLVARLHAAEDGQVRAERRLAEVEAEASRRLLDLQGELEGARASLARSEAQAEDIRAAYRRKLIERDTGS
jgi:phage terminase Nu1 subunit (DNA packaging protein)